MPTIAISALTAGQAIGWASGNGTVSNSVDLTGTLTATQIDAGTNTILYPLELIRTSSDTPAAGIGCGLKLTVETAAGNNEIGAVIEAVTTDVTATSEDFDLVFKLMIAGAAATQALRINSTGLLRIGATIHTDIGATGLTFYPSGGYDQRITTGANMSMGTWNGNSHLLLYANGVLIVVLHGTSGFMGVGTGAPDRLLHSEITDAGTNTVLYPLRLTRISSGTPAAGIGAGLELEVETAADNNEVGAVIEAVTTDVTSTSEDFDLVFKLMAAGAAAAEKFRIVSDGTLQFGTHASIVGETLSGFITINDSGGTPRKVAVVS